MAERLVRNMDDEDSKRWWEVVLEAAKSAPKLEYSESAGRSVPSGKPVREDAEE